MKRMIGIALFAGILSIITGCSDNNNSHEYLNQPPLNNTDCLPYLPGFIETYRDCIAQDEVYFVKGEVTAAGSYGMEIKILEDLKGNFKNDPSITLWNHWEFGVSDLKQKTGNIVLILMSRIGESSDSWGKERQGDYLTITCRTSFLLLSDENVTGIINSNSEEMTMPWNVLQEQLPTACQSNMSFVENYKASINREDVYFIKGAVVQESFSYGIKIKPVKDLKGNFPVSTVIGVWGKGDLSNSIDVLCTYYRDTSSIPTDTLYMLLRPIVAEDIPSYSNRKEGDYSTVECAHSIVTVGRYDSNLVALRGENGEWMTVEEFEDRFGINPNK